MYRAAWYWISFLPISLCSVGIAVANGAGPSNLQHSALVFRTDTPIPLDGDLNKMARSGHGYTCRGTSGKPSSSWDRLHSVRSGKSLFGIQCPFFEASGQLPRTRWRQTLGRDRVEFLIDALLQRTKEFLPDDFSYHINILNAVYDDRGTSSGQPDPDWNVLHNTQYE